MSNKKLCYNNLYNTAVLKSTGNNNNNKKLESRLDHLNNSLDNHNHPDLESKINSMEKYINELRLEVSKHEKYESEHIKYENKIDELFESKKDLLNRLNEIEIKNLKNHLKLENMIEEYNKLLLLKIELLQSDINFNKETIKKNHNLPSNSENPSVLNSRLSNFKTIDEYFQSIVDLRYESSPSNLYKMPKNFIKYKNYKFISTGSHIIVVDTINNEIKYSLIAGFGENENDEESDKKYMFSKKFVNERKLKIDEHKYAFLQFSKTTTRSPVTFCTYENQQCFVACSNGYGQPYVGIYRIADGKRLLEFDADIDNSTLDIYGNYYDPTSDVSYFHGATRQTPIVETLNGKTTVYAAIAYGVEYIFKGLFFKEDQNILGYNILSGCLNILEIKNEKVVLNQRINSLPDIIKAEFGKKITDNAFGVGQNKILSYFPLREDSEIKNSNGVITNGNRIVNIHVDKSFNIVDSDKDEITGLPIELYGKKYIYKDQDNLFELKIEKNGIILKNESSEEEIKYDNILELENDTNYTMKLDNEKDLKFSIDFQELNYENLNYNLETFKDASDQWLVEFGEENFKLGESNEEFKATNLTNNKIEYFTANELVSKNLFNNYIQIIVKKEYIWNKDLVDEEPNNYIAYSLTSSGGNPWQIGMCLNDIDSSKFITFTTGNATRLPYDLGLTINMIENNIKQTHKAWQGGQITKEKYIEYVTTISQTLLDNISPINRRIFANSAITVNRNTKKISQALRTTFWDPWTVIEFGGLASFIGLGVTGSKGNLEPFGLWGPDADCVGAYPLKDKTKFATATKGGVIFTGVININDKEPLLEPIDKKDNNMGSGLKYFKQPNKFSNVVGHPGTLGGVNFGIAISDDGTKIIANILNSEFFGMPFKEWVFEKDGTNYPVNTGYIVCVNDEAEIQWHNYNGRSFKDNINDEATMAYPPSTCKDFVFSGVPDGVRVFDLNTGNHILDIKYPNVNNESLCLPPGSSIDKNNDIYLSFIHSTGNLVRTKLKFNH